MPSLRRTLSTPSVRSSPYSYPSSSSANTHATRAGNSQPRRSSGSDTSNRRVLADLDWWVVQDGQREFAASPPGDNNDDDGSDEQDAAENEQVRPPRATPALQDVDIAAVAPQATAPPAVAGLGGFHDEMASSPLWDVSLDSPMGGLSSLEAISPFSPFASLSLAPRTPFRRSASESSQSSVDSSPEANSSFPLPTFMDVLRPAAPAYPSVFASGLGLGRPATTRAPPLAARSVSYSAVEFQLSSARVHDSRFEDIVPSPPPFFSATMDDNEMEDLFYE